MRNKPRIRFKGFTEDWEQCKLGDLLILLKDGSHGTHKNTSEGVYLLSAKNIKNGRINIMPDDRIISLDDYNVIHKNYELQSGDILLTIVGSIGETAIYNLKTKVTFQRSVAFLRPNSKLKNGFLYTLINTDRFQNELQTKQVVSAQPGIYLGDLASINITYPKNISEQEKIYNIFKGIENSITLHQRKLEKLKLAKKALLQKLFPKNGSQFPEIRFKGFTDAWEQRKLNDLVTIRRGLTYKPSDIAENGIRVLRSSNIYEDQFITSNDDVFVNIEAVNIPFAKNGDILITSANGSNRLVGKHTIIRDIADNSAVHGGFMLLAESNNPLFTDALLSSNWYKRFINTYVAGGNGAIGNLSKSDLESQTAMVPSEHEQAKIGQWYDNINQLITLHQCKLDKLQDVKKGLLQKMFV